MSEIRKMILFVEESNALIEVLREFSHISHKIVAVKLHFKQKDLSITLQNFESISICCGLKTSLI